MHGVRKAELSDITPQRRNIRRIYIYIYIYIIITDKKYTVLFFKFRLENDLCLGLFFCDSKIAGAARFNAGAS